MALNSRQKKFAKLIADGVPQAEAAAASGYANEKRGSLAVTASRLMRNPDVQRAAFEQREARLTGPLARKAMATLESVLDDETAPAPARVKAAVWILEAGGHGLQAKLGAARLGLDNADKPLSQRTAAELEEFIARQEIITEGLRKVSGPVIEAEAAEDPGEAA